MTDQPERFHKAIAIIQGMLSLNGSHPVVTVGNAVFSTYVSKVVRRKHQPGQVQKVIRQNSRLSLSQSLVLLQLNRGVALVKNIKLKRRRTF
jgi:hypothetical protein